MIYEVTHTAAMSRLFDGWEETLIWSCLQGIMGKIYADDLRHPQAAMAVLGDFVFLAGEPNRELTSYEKGWQKASPLLVPQNEDWLDEIQQVYGERAKVLCRYALKNEPGVFDLEKLERAAILPEPYRILMIDARLYQMCQAEAWSADLTGQFPDYESYRRLGIGVAVCKDGAVVAGASSYSRYCKGIEIQIDTREEYRRKGLAYACGARLILECLKRGLYPSWDAHTRESLALAEKLGYHYSHTYSAVEIRKSLSLQD